MKTHAAVLPLHDCCDHWVPAVQELEMLSDHGGMLKTKRETQAKYGW